MLDRADNREETPEQTIRRWRRQASSSRLVAGNRPDRADGAGARGRLDRHAISCKFAGRSLSARPFTPFVYTVDTTSAALADNRPVIRLYGQVDTGRSVELRAAVSGDVVEIHPDLVAGRRVTD
jgi:hypothetical protein